MKERFKCLVPPPLTKSDIATIMKFATKYSDNDLWKFYINKPHRCIDKWLHYFGVYEQWFSKFRGKEFVFVEIGVQNGGSIQMWKDYFGDKAKIIGVDIEPKCKQFEDEQATIEIGSQSDVEFWNAFKEKYPKVDVLLDDGGHTMAQQIITFQCMFSHIAEGGIYMCEDTHTSYDNVEPYYQGGNYNDTQNNYMGFAKTFIDMINAPHSFGNIPVTYESINMSGVHFYESMVVIEKERRLLAPLALKIGDMGTVLPFEDTIKLN